MHIMRNDLRSVGSSAFRGTPRISCGCSSGRMARPTASRCADDIDGQKLLGSRRLHVHVHVYLLNRIGKTHNHRSRGDKRGRRRTERRLLEYGCGTVRGSTGALERVNVNATHATTGATALLLPAQIHTLYMTLYHAPYETRSMRELAALRMVWACAPVRCPWCRSPPLCCEHRRQSTGTGVVGTHHRLKVKRL